ncbi:ankyrin repeat domain-containing protein [Anatilimnocola sp. NA78]|uniref:ankyrin repeat domain-containing protein n=1 Tax=Anatilimnocola sp. NA78 TaxID=3415683 RepID=UPI003CE5C193
MSDSKLDLPVIKAIRNAIRSGNVEDLANQIGEDDSRLHFETPFGTWLHEAAAKGQIEVAKLLIARGIDVNARGGLSDGNPLLLAATMGQTAMVKFLLSVGGEMDTTAVERNPLMSAIYGDYPDVAKLLLDAGIDTKVKYLGESGRIKNALSFAQEYGRTEIAQLILESAGDAAQL